MVVWSAAPGGFPGEGLDAWLDRVARLRAAESVLREVFLERGYREVRVPALEEVEPARWVRSRGTPAPAHREQPAYRFVDHEGRVWGLRADVTPGLARMLWQGDPDGPRPRRLFYLAEVYRRVAGRPGPVPLVQAGAEVVGAPGPREDAAILSLAAAALRALGLEEFRLAVGHVGFLRGLLGAAGLSAEGCDGVLAALQSRDYVGLRRVVESCLPAAEAEVLARALTWKGTPGELLADLWPSLRALTGGRGWSEDLQLLLEACSDEPRVLVDLGLVRDMAYYTGMVFEILLPGLPQPVGGGGRYDGTLSPEPATGFAFDLGTLVESLPLAAALRERVRVSPVH